MRGDSPTAELAAFAAELDFDAVPSQVIEHAKLALRDLIGCALYGSTRQWSRLVRDYVVAESARPAATVWGSEVRTSPSLAALANATAAHSAELDDLHKASFFHPGAAVVPAAFASLASPDVGGDGVGPRTGRDLLTGVVAGVEVGARVGKALDHGHFLAGYHPQGTVGTLAAAAAAGALRGLTPGQLRHAFGIAGTQAAGLMAAQEGAMVKRLHAGFACEAGTRAAALAAAGVTGIENLFEASFGGLLSTLGTADSDVAALTDGLGSVWQTGSVEFKHHAACAAIHSALDVIEELRQRREFRVEEVAEVAIRCTTHSYVHCGFEYQPNGVTAAQMSYQYCVAAMLRLGRVSVTEFDEALLARPDLLDLARRVHVAADPALDVAGPDYRHTVRVELRLTGGEVLAGQRTHRRGGVDEPLGEAELADKFRTLAGHVLPADRVGELLAALGQVELLPDARELEQALVSAGQPR